MKAKVFIVIAIARFAIAVVAVPIIVTGCTVYEPVPAYALLLTALSGRGPLP